MTSGGTDATARAAAMAMPRAGYVIAGTARSGSSWFARVLRSTGHLGVPAEYFNRVYLQATFGQVPENPRDWVPLVYRHGMTPNGIYALKAFPMHLTVVMREVDLREALPGLRFVQWRRRDVLGQAISLCRANQTRQWRSTMQPLAEPSYDGQAIYASLARIVHQNARWELFFARNGIVPLRLVYEDALADPQSAADAVARFMALDARPRIGARIDLEVQRDSTTEEWRQRFVSDFGALDGVDLIPS